MYFIFIEKTKKNKKKKKESGNKVQNLIKSKKRNFFKNKLTENIGKPKELWKTLKDIGLSTKNSTTANICLKDKDDNISGLKK